MMGSFAFRSPIVNSGSLLIFMPILPARDFKQKEPSFRRAPVGFLIGILSYGIHVRGLGALGAFRSFEAHFLALGEGFEAVAFDLREVHKQICPVLALNKAEAFLIGEPFDCSFWQVNSSSHHSRGRSTRSTAKRTISQALQTKLTPAF